MAPLKSAPWVLLITVPAWAACVLRDERVCLQANWWLCGQPAQALCTSIACCSEAILQHLQNPQKWDSLKSK